MKIAFISMIRDSWGGSEELWYSAAKFALEEGHEVLHSAFDCGEIHPKTADLLDKGAKMFYRRGYIAPNSSKANRFFQLSVNFLKNKFSNPFSRLFAEKPDIVVYTGTAYSIAKEKFLKPFLTKQRLPFYIVVQMNQENAGSITHEEAGMVKKFYLLAKKVFFVSERNLRVAERQIGSTISNGIVVRNPVNLPSIERIPFPKDIIPHFAMVGNLVTAHKGQDIALRVLASPSWRERNFILNIYGTGKDESKLKDLTGSYNIEEKVIFQGKVNDIRGIWKANHLLIMPSHMEGMPLAMVEAMLCGRPVVATNVGGISEWVEEGRSGFIADEITDASFAKAMEKAWDVKNNWEEMGIRAHEQAGKLYDPRPGQTLFRLITETK